MITRSRSRSSWAVWIAGALVLLPVLYVAGIGPLLWLDEDNSLAAPDAAHAAYDPLLRLGERYEPVRRLLDWYAALWGVDLSWFGD